jgi:DNA-3-methyladenine glycosylase II
MNTPPPIETRTRRDLVPTAKRTARKKSIIIAGAHEPVDPWAEGVDHLRQLDPKWQAIIEEVGPCKLVLRPDRFGALVRAIIGQQISSKAAASIDKRVRELAGEPHAPEAILQAGEAALRTCGLSGVKARYVLNLAQAVRDGEVPLDEVHAWEDEAIVAALTSIKGVGPWTAEMFLIFALGRPDVLSPGDLGIRAGLKRFYELDELPNPRECHELTEKWRPHRTVAMWYLWKGIDEPKKSG